MCRLIVLAGTNSPCRSRRKGTRSTPWYARARGRGGRRTGSVVAPVGAARPRSLADPQRLRVRVRAVRADVLPVRGLDERVVDAWRGLVAHAVEPNPFHQPECVLPAVRCLTGGNDVELLVVWSGAELVFVLPVERIRRYRRLPMPAWSWWRHPYAYLSTPLLASGVDGQAVWEAVLSRLASQGNEWMLALDLFSLDGPVSDALHMAATDRH